ncbi:MAG: hypothetical protein HRU09_02950 [Oligoflexales bacterium]|nr:hypothetical protein [Oligoflexales bacterium]
MKKGIIFGVVIAAVAAFFVLRNKPKTEEKAPQVQQTEDKGQEYKVVSQAKWDESKPRNSGSAPASQNKKEALKKENSDLTRVEKAVAKFVDSSGLEKKLLSMNSMLEQQIEMLISDQTMTDEERASFLKAFKSNFDGKKLLEEYTGRMKSEYSEEELEKLAEIYEDPSVQRFNQLNNDMVDPANMQDYQQDFVDFMKNLDQNPDNSERVKLFQDLDKAMNTSGQAVKLTMELFNMYAEKDGEAALSPEEASGFQAAIADQVQKGLMFTLRDSADGEVKDLAEKLNHPMVRNSNDVLVDTFTGPLKNVMSALENNKPEPQS